MKRLIKILLALLIIEHGSSLVSGIQGYFSSSTSVGTRVSEYVENVGEFFRRLGFEPQNEKSS